MQTASELIAARAARVVPPYRNLVLSFGAELVLTMVAMARGSIPSATGREAIDLLVSVSSLCTMAALAYFGYRTADALGSRYAFALAVGMLVPLVNVVTLLSLSSRATRVCRAAGIRVGLLGPKALVNTGREKDGAA
jgi:hypothetical protein